MSSVAPPSGLCDSLEWRSVLNCTALELHSCTFRENGSLSSMLDV